MAGFDPAWNRAFPLSAGSTRKSSGSNLGKKTTQALHAGRANDTRTQKPAIFRKITSRSESLAHEPRIRVAGICYWLVLGAGSDAVPDDSVGSLRNTFPGKLANLGGAGLGQQPDYNATIILFLLPRWYLDHRRAGTQLSFRHDVGMADQRTTRNLATIFTRMFCGRRNLVSAGLFRHARILALAGCQELGTTQAKTTKKLMSSTRL